MKNFYCLLLTVSLLALSQEAFASRSINVYIDRIAVNSLNTSCDCCGGNEEPRWRFDNQHDGNTDCWEHSQHNQGWVEHYKNDHLTGWSVPCNYQLTTGFWVRMYGCENDGASCWTASICDGGDNNVSSGNINLRSLGNGDTYFPSSSGWYSVTGGCGSATYYFRMRINKGGSDDNQCGNPGLYRDNICWAEDFGTLSPNETEYGGSVGNGGFGKENCGYISEPGGQDNTVWYKFTTSNPAPTRIAFDVDAGGACTPWSKLYREDSGLPCNGTSGRSFQPCVSPNPFSNNLTEIADGGLDGYEEVSCPPAGQTYYIQADITGLCSTGTVQGVEAIGWAVAAPDRICDALRLGSGTVGVGQTRHSGASRLSNICSTPNTGGYTDPGQAGGTGTVWFWFNTPAAASMPAQHTVEVYDPSGFDLFGGVELEVYKAGSGTCDYSLSHVGGDDPTGCNDEASVTLCLDPSSTYYVMVNRENEGACNNSGGEFKVRAIGSSHIAAGDICSQATPLPGGPLTSGGSVGTTSGGTYSNICAGSDADPSGCSFDNDKGVWFTFSTDATAGGYANFYAYNTGGDNIDLSITVYKGSCGSLTEVACDYTFPIWSEDLEKVCIEPSTTYYVVIDGGVDILTDLHQGTFDLQVVDLVEPGNDLPCGAYPITTQPFNTHSYTDMNNLTNVNGSNCTEPNPGWTSNGNDHVVWWEVDIPGRRIVIDANSGGNAIDIQLALYEEDTDCSDLDYIERDWFLSPLFCVDGLCDEDFITSSCLDPTKKYYLAVDGGSAAGINSAMHEGTFDMDVYFPREGGLTPCLYSDPGNLYGAPRIGAGAIPTGGFVELLNNSNFCGLDDAALAANGWPDPGWGADEAVWFVFRPPASGSVRIDAYSDPYIGPRMGFGAGDELDLQLAVLESSDGTCSPPTWSVAASENNSVAVAGLDEYLIVNCLDPNKDYYLLVDGAVGISFTTPSGFFDLKITDYGKTTPHDLVCDAINIMTHPDVTAQQITDWNTCNTQTTLTLTNQNNYCATNVFEPVPPNWAGATSHMVWYTFTAPPSGAVWLELNTVTTNPLKPEYLNAKLAIYDLRPGVDPCIGNPFLATDHLASDYDLDVPPASTGEDLFDTGLGLFDRYVRCLIPGETYYIAVDGHAALPGWDYGEFELSITSSPDDMPGTNDLLYNAATPLCNAIPLGQPVQGSVVVGTNTSYGGVNLIPTTGYGLAHNQPRSAVCMRAENNFCMGNTGDPDLSTHGFGLWGLDQTAWYSFVAPATGSVNIDILSDPAGLGDEIGSQIVVVETDNGDCNGTLNLLEADYDAFFPFDESMEVHCLTEGETYYMAVDGSVGGILDWHQGYFEVSIQAIDPLYLAPPHDDICNARPIDPFAGNVTISLDSNRCAHVEPAIPEPSSFGKDRTVWYTFTTPVGNPSYAVNVDVVSDWPWPFGDFMDPQIALYQSDGSCSGTITNFDSDWDPIPPGLESFEFQCLLPGTQYWLMVDGAAYNAQGYFDLYVQEITPEPIAVNDEACNVVNAASGALGILPLGGQLGGFGGGDPLWNNFCADAAGEPDPDAFGLDQTVWFSFTTPTIAGANDGVNVDIAVDNSLSYGDMIDLQLAVYLSGGGCAGPFTEVESAYNPVGPNALDPWSESMSLCLREGTEYWIQVDGSLINTQGYFKLRINDTGNTLRPSNDDFCTTPTPVTVGTLLTGQNNFCATVELGEPGAGTEIQKSVWYSFVAPAQGRVSIQIQDTDGVLGIDPEWNLYEFNGTCPAGFGSGSIIELASSYIPLVDETTDIECLFPGDTYYLQVDGVTLLSEGTFNVNIQPLIPGWTPPANDECTSPTTLTVQTESCQYEGGTWEDYNYGEPSRSLRDVAGCTGNCGDTWYTFDMPATGFAKIEGNDEVFPTTTLSVVAYNSSDGTCNNLQYLDCGTGGIGQDVDFSITGTPGEQIWLQVYGDDQWWIADDDNQNFQICVSERCSADDCPDAVTDMEFGVEYCWDIRDATGEFIATGDEGYNVCGTAQEPRKSVYFKFTTDDFCWAYDITISGLDLSQFGSCTAGNIPSSELTMSVFQDNDGTLCDNIYTDVLDCEIFNDCTYPGGAPSGWSKTITYFVGTGNNEIQTNSTYIIELHGEDYFGPGFVTSDDIMDGMISVNKVCDGREWEYVKGVGTTVSDGYCKDSEGWRHYYDDNGTTSSTPTLLANSSAEWSGTQGQNNWYYGMYFAFSTNDFEELPNFTGSVWNNPGTNLDFPQLDQNGGHPQLENYKWAVRRWISEYQGDIRVDLDFFDRDLGCGNGAHIRLFHNTTEVWQYFGIPGSLTEHSVYIPNVELGDRIDLVIDPDGTDVGCDNTHLTAEIHADITEHWHDDLLIFSVFDNGNIFDGEASISMADDYYKDEAVTNLAASYVTRRLWDFELTSGWINPNFPVDIRFYYEQYEKQEIIDAAVNFAAAQTPALIYEPFEWFKSRDWVDFDPVLHINPYYVTAGYGSASGSAVTGAIEYVPTYAPELFPYTEDADAIDWTGPGNAIDVPNVWCNGVQYVQIGGLIGFSGGGGATGAGIFISPLPVELLSFVGWNEGPVNKLEWITASEVNNELFVVERSADGIDFIDIGELPGHGTTSEEHTYNLTDFAPIQGLNYYRLRQINIDQTFDYSPIIVIEVTTSELQTAIVGLHPNPTMDVIHIQLQSSKETTFDMLVTDILGRIVHRGTIEAQAGLNAPFTLDAQQYATGTYIISLTDVSTGLKLEDKFIKQN